MMDTMVELSFKISSTVVNTASGPLTNARIASCGTYVSRNMPVTTPTDRVNVGSSFESSGFQRARCVTKYMIP